MRASSGWTTPEHCAEVFRYSTASARTHWATREPTASAACRLPWRHTARGKCSPHQGKCYLKGGNVHGSARAPLVATAQGSSLDGAVCPPRSRLLREAPGRSSPYKAGRKLTVMCYLNGHWQPSSGGELRIWPRPPPSQLPGSDRQEGSTSCSRLEMGIDGDEEQQPIGQGDRDDGRSRPFVRICVPPLVVGRCALLQERSHPQPNPRPHLHPFRACVKMVGCVRVAAFHACGIKWCIGRRSATMPRVARMYNWRDGAGWPRSAAMRSAAHDGPDV